MKKLWNDLGYLPVAIFLIIVLAMSLWGMMKFSVSEYKVVLINPTEEQVLQLYKSGGNNKRLWVREIHSVKGENSILEATIGVRKSDGGEIKIVSVLEKLQLDYYSLGEVAIR